MTHEKTFAAIAKLKDIEVELHRLKNALEMANKALDAKREWVGLTDEEIDCLYRENNDTPGFNFSGFARRFARAIEAKLKEKNT